MNLKGTPKGQIARLKRGIAIIEVVMVLIVLGFLAAFHAPMYGRFREKHFITVDMNNVRQILQGSAMYNADNNDHMAHPTWGSDLRGPDGWAYATENRGRIPGAPNLAPNCAGRDVNSLEFTNQVKFFQRGQVTQYLPDVKTAWCPKDVATRGYGALKQRWIGRPVKVTSYCWTGAVGGFIGPKAANLNNRTYKVSEFLENDWLMWEQNENDSFNFNDAGSNPETVGEIVSYRHSGTAEWWRSSIIQRSLGGGGVIGTFGGEAKFVKWPRVWDLINRKVGSPNELLNGPGFQR